MKSTKAQHPPRGSTLWTPRELQKLKDGLRSGKPISQLAQQLRCEIGEVRTKIAELTTRHLANRQLTAQRHENRRLTVRQFRRVPKVGPHAQG
jgi:hypothetical protein